MNRIERIEYTRTETLGQPEALRATLAQVEAAAPGLQSAFQMAGRRAIYVVGSGDSFIVGQAVAAAWEDAFRVPVIAMQALEFARQRFALVDERVLVIAISASGGSWATEQALRRASELGAVTLAVSGVSPSPLTDRSRYQLVVPATRVGWPTQSTTCQIAALLSLAQRFRVGTAPADATAWDTVPGLVRSVLDAVDAPMQRLARDLRSRTSFILAGSGTTYAAARMGAAKIKEMSHDRAEAIYLEEFHHYVTVNAGDVLFLLIGGDRVTDRAIDTAQQASRDGAHVVAVMDSPAPELRSAAAEVVELPSVDDEVRSIVFALPVHIFSQQLAMAKKQPGWAEQDHQGRLLAR